MINIETLKPGDRVQLRNGVECDYEELWLGNFRPDGKHTIEKNLDIIMIIPHEPKETRHTADPIVNQVIETYKRRSVVGMKVYGQSMYNNPEGLRHWLQNALEEAMDFTLYLQRAIEEIDRRARSDTDL